MESIVYRKQERSRTDHMMADGFPGIGETCGNGAAKDRGDYSTRSVGFKKMGQGEWATFLGK